MYGRSNQALTSCRRLAAAASSWVRPGLVLGSMEAKPTGEDVKMQQGKGNKGKKGKKMQTDTIPKILRYKEKQKGNLPVPAIIDLQVIGNGAAASPRSMMANLYYFRYLFNCGEGTQRIATEYKMKVSRISDVFITHRNWENIGGLLGMILSMESVKIPSVRIHGPPGVEKLVTMSRGFAQLIDIGVEKREVSEGPYEDTAMKIEYVPLYPSSSALNQGDSEEPAAKKKKVSKEEDMSVVYICTPHQKPAAVSLEKCVDLGVPWGPYIGKLKNGQEITLENGTVVKPEDVLYPQERSLPFLVVECPDDSYLDSLEASAALQAFHTADISAALVVHFTPPAVMQHSRYQDWMTRFGEETRHLLLNGTGSRVSMEGVYRVQSKLNLLHPDIFPLLPYQQQPQHVVNDVNASSTVTGEPGLLYYLRGSVNDAQFQFSREKCIALDHDRYVAEAYEEGDGFEEALKETRQKLQDAPVSSVNHGNTYPEIVFLGTGSAVPNKARNVSAILMHLSEDKCMLLDCGEDSYGQLVRHYGDGTPDLLKKLVSVFITHLHADHHMGLLRLALAKEATYLSLGETPTPLRVYAPKAIQPWIENVDRHVQHLSPNLLRVTPVEHLLPDSRADHQGEYQQALDVMDLSEFRPVPVWHRQYPHGIVLTHRDGWKVTYSGDTLPCHHLARAGHGSDILIHEASMEDTLAEEAKTKKHCTTSQAISIGMQMEAKFILLTHFSQRYAKVPIFNDKFSARVGIAFDNMRVRPCDLSLLPHFTPALKAMFAEHYAAMEEKREKRMMAKMRQEMAEKEEGASSSSQGQQSVARQPNTQPKPPPAGMAVIKTLLHEQGTKQAELSNASNSNQRSTPGQTGVEQGVSELSGTEQITLDTQHTDTNIEPAKDKENDEAKCEAQF